MITYQQQFTDLDDAMYFMEQCVGSLDPTEIREAKLVLIGNRWVVGVIIEEVE